MIKTIAIHKLTKLRHSKMILIFSVAAISLALLVFLPVLFIRKISGMPISVGAFAGRYFGLIDFFGWIVSLTLGASLWRQDEKDGTLFSFMAKPVSRIQMLYGKLLGCFYALLIYLGIAVVLFLILDLFFIHGTIPALMPVYFLQLIFVWLAYLLMALLFSNFSSPLVASFLAVFGGFLSFLGRQLGMFNYDTAIWIGRILRFPFIDASKEFQLDDLYVPELAVTKDLLSAAGYFALWTVCLLAASILIFKGREFYGKRS